MATRSVHIQGVVGANTVLSAPARMFVKVAPAYRFVNGSTINWPDAVEFEMPGGEVTISGMEDTYQGDPLVWWFRIYRRDSLGNQVMLEEATKKFPTGSGLAEYTAMLDVDPVVIPEFGPTYLQQTLEARDQTIQAMTDGLQDALDAISEAGQEWIVSATPEVDWTGAVTLSQAQTRAEVLFARLTGNTTLTLAAGVAGRCPRRTCGHRSVSKRRCRRRRTRLT